MADNINTETNLEQQSNVPDDQSQELAQSMRLALGLNEPTNTVPNSQEVIVNESAEDAPITETQAPLTFEVIKEKFNYGSPEDAIKEIEELRKFKDNPVAEIEFENEQSRKLFDAIKAGKQKEAYAILAEQETLDTYTSQEVTKDNADDIIKLGMKYKYKDQSLTAKDIEHKFKKQFAIPKEPVQSVSEDEDDFKVRHAEWEEMVNDIEMDKILEAKLSKSELEKHKVKIVLPEIEPDVDQDYVSFKQAQEERQKIDTETIEAYKSFTPKSIETKINFNDEANKIAFDFQYEPTAEGLKKSVDMVTDINKFYQTFIGQDGKPDRERFLKAIHFALNAESVLMEAMKQAKNATIKSQLPNNNGNQTQRMMPQGQEVSELDAYMALALNGNGRGRN